MAGLEVTMSSIGRGVAMTAWDKRDILRDLAVLAPGVDAAFYAWRLSWRLLADGVGAGYLLLAATPACLWT